MSPPAEGEPRGADVVLHIYYARAVRFGGGATGQRLTGKGGLNPLQKGWKDLTGQYHVTVAVRGREYVFGSYQASSKRCLGDDSVSGVYMHDVCKPGPGFDFKQAVHVGRTTYSTQQIQNIAELLGRERFNRSSYNMYRHNCADFAQTLVKALGINEFPGWVRRGADMVRAAEEGINNIMSLLGAGSADDDAASTQDGASALVEVPHVPATLPATPPTMAQRAPPNIVFPATVVPRQVRLVRVRAVPMPSLLRRVAAAGEFVASASIEAPGPGRMR